MKSPTGSMQIPDTTTGKQYHIKESTTTASKKDQERTEVDETLSITLERFSNRLDSLSGKVDAMLNQKETVVELSWWDLHKDEIYVGIIVLIIIGVIFWRRKE